MYLVAYLLRILFISAVVFHDALKVLNVATKVIDEVAAFDVFASSFAHHQVIDGGAWIPSWWFPGTHTHC